MAEPDADELLVRAADGDADARDQLFALCRLRELMDSYLGGFGQ